MPGTGYKCGCPLLLTSKPECFHTCLLHRSLQVRDKFSTCSIHVFHVASHSCLYYNCACRLVLYVLDIL